MSVPAVQPFPDHGGLFGDLDTAEAQLTPRAFVRAGAGGIDLRVLAFVVDAWINAQPIGLLQPAELSLGEVAQGVYAGNPGGAGRRMVREALERLYALDFPVTPASGSVIVERARLFSGLSMPDAEASLADLAAQRGRSTIRIYLTPVLAAQARGGQLDWLGAVPIRTLQAVAERLWLWLEGATFRPSLDGLEATLELTPVLLEVLGIGAARGVDARVSARRAGERVVAADRRYSSIRVEQRRGRWVLVATRRAPGQAALAA